MAKKHKGAKLPKRIAGFKLSKATRKNVGRVLALLGTPTATALIGAAVAGIAGAIAGRGEARVERGGASRT